MLALAGIVGAGRGDDDGDPRHGCGSQRCQAEHEAVGRGAGGAAVITSVRTKYRSGGSRSRMRYRGACETLAYVLEALDYSPPAYAIGAETADSGSSAVGADADAAP